MPTKMEIVIQVDLVDNGLIISGALHYKRGPGEVSVPYIKRQFVATIEELKLPSLEIVESF